MTEENAEKKKDSGLIQTTLAELGASLLLGSNPGGANPDKTLSLREITTADERVIANKTKENMPMAEQISIVIAQCIDQLGEYDFSKTKWPERIVRINNFYMADILCALCQLRIQTLGPEIKTDFNCSCSPSVKRVIEADLSTTRVTAPKSEKDTFWEYTLKSPITVREKELKSLIIGSPRWGMISKILTTSRKEAELETVRGCIVGYNGTISQFGEVLRQEEFDLIKKRDLASILSQINSHTIGPHMSIETQCPNCDQEKKLVIDWQYSRFFSVPSQSSP